MDLIRDPGDGADLDVMTTMYPSRLECVRGRRAALDPTSTFYGYVVWGRARIRSSGLEITADAGGFFSLPGPVELSVEGAAVLIERRGFRGLPVAGRIEEVGRLACTDGCSDTVLVSPPRCGDPVLSHLHCPPGVRQTLHTQPTICLGVVARGEGVAFGPEDRWVEPLTEGTVFLLHPHEAHAFRTGENRRPLDVIAFHPDSDWGPTDAAHPMLNRTYLGRDAAGRPR